MQDDESGSPERSVPDRTTDRLDRAIDDVVSDMTRTTIADDEALARVLARVRASERDAHGGVATGANDAGADQARGGTGPWMPPGLEPLRAARVSRAAWTVAAAAACVLLLIAVAASLMRTPLSDDEARADRSAAARPHTSSASAPASADVPARAGAERSRSSALTHSAPAIVPAPADRPTRAAAEPSTVQRATPAARRVTASGRDDDRARGQPLRSDLAPTALAAAPIEEPDAIVLDGIARPAVVVDPIPIESLVTPAIDPDR